ncbi:ELMO domain-containing protein 2 [Hermetia illucens]|uniref:ELMO domain-containing protein 2 n=1 Tax=Hermetia illucens TaxID=343691 RepID=UPI0018CC23A8|nr:ELMO domain-containing protein 2 [Hermetia illucens]
MALIQVNNFASTGGGNATRSSLFLTMLFKNFLTYLYFYFRPFIKWFLRRFTRLCELQRICYGSPAGAARTRQVEMSLQLSRRREIREMMNILDNEVEHCSEYELRELVKKMVMTVMMAKKIKPRNHPDFARLFGECVEQIWGYRRLICIVEAIRTDQYDPDNLNNEKKLFQLWSLLMPDDRLESRITKQWQDIGFQGDDPKTDFRGMGLLGLENLLFFSSEYNSAARHVLSHSHHPNHGYTFAIVGINLTSMAYRLVKAGKAKTHFYNITRRAPRIEHFHKFYCYLFFEFDRFWISSKPKSIMDFSIIQEKFERNILSVLDEDSTVFKMNNLVVEHI